MVPLLVSGSTWKEVAPKWAPITMPTAAHSVPPPSMEWLSALAAEQDKLPMPYIAESFRKSLESDILTSRYPLLVQDITYGSPIGVPMQLSHTTVMPNLHSAELRQDLVSDYIAKEVSFVQMAGPFTLEETHLVFEGHFRTVPVGLMEKDPSKCTFHMIQHFSKEHALGVSVNSQLDSDNFPTRWKIM